MNFARLFLTIVIAVALAASAQSQSDDSNGSRNPTASQTGDLKITFKFKGTPPKPEPLELPASCGNLEMTDETLIVNGNNNGIMNVVVFAHRGHDSQTFPAISEPRLKKQTLACWNCRFVPRISTAQVGDTLVLRNMDEIGYHVNFSFFKNDVQNIAMAPGRERDLSLETSEPGVIPVAASIFPWMVGYVLVADHSFYDVSNPDGRILIRGLPVGKKLTFRAWHERGTFKKQIHVNGKKTRWEANKFEVEIKPGMNDLGTVELAANAFE